EWPLQLLPRLDGTLLAGELLEPPEAHFLLDEHAALSVDDEVLGVAGGAGDTGGDGYRRQVHRRSPQAWCPADFLQQMTSRFVHGLAIEVVGGPRPGPIAACPRARACAPR